ncbi:helix-turn-helix transcriptional regulator [Sphingomonas sp. ABOLF]|uniref:XRE family transcriptional regulator n=1 Tax=Sphingomonas sp. ABOLF TaxID=1985879 RepID=UPI000F7E588F|nr:S24 family peptidase [Sphingomonas sp. ABOLF]RSV12308.1 helix-turn-helix transcriptional regulator [Sphingomonas sp. ABOLF]
MIHSERVRALMAERGLSQSALARAVGVTQGAIAKIVSSNPGGSSHLHKIARELGTSVAYLTGETDDRSEGALPLPTPVLIAEQLDLVEIRSIDFAYGMGGTFGEDHIEEEVLHFPRKWIQAITSSPAPSLTFARGRGDSMAPTMNEGDVILIDRAQRTVLEQDAIWALTLGPIAMVKRLRIRGEQVTILSDNDRVAPDRVHADEVNIVGRVVFVGRRL